MRYTFKISLHLLFYFISSSCLSQDLLFNVQYFNQDDGLSDRNIYCVNQDDRGLIWVGTGNGLNRFDGHKFREIGEQNSKTSSGNILAIRKNENGNFWIQKENEPVIYFDPYKEEIIPLPNNDGLELIFPIIGKEKIWLKNNENNVFYIDKENDFVPFTKTKKSFKKILIATTWNTLLFNDFLSKKVIEVNEKGDTVRVFDRSLLTVYNDERGEARFTVFWEKNKNLFLNQFLFEIKEKGDLLPFNLSIDGRPFDLDGIDEEGGINCHFRKDNKGNYWMVVGRKVFFFDKEKRFQKEISNELFDLSGYSWNANEIFIDDHNRLWLSTGVGLFVIEVRENPFQLYLGESGKTSTRGIVDNLQNEIFIANYHLAKKIDKDSKEIIKSYDFYGSAVSRITDDQIWVGKRNSLIILDEKENTQTIIEVKKDNKFQIFNFLLDPEIETVYLGTNEGLWYSNIEASDIKKVNKLNEFKGFEDAYIQHLIKNKEGVWIATFNGIYLYDSQKGLIKHVSFPNNEIKFIHEDKQGDFWLATNGGGLIHWDRKNNIKHQLTTRDGLSHDVIYAVYEDDEGYLWLPSNNGLMRFEKSTREVNVFQPEDGIAHKEFNTFSHYQAADGRLYFGGLNGVTAFYPEELKLTQNDAPLIVTQLQQFDADEGKLVDKTKEFQQTNSISLSSFDKFFTIEFSILDYVRQNHLYGWKIKGLDKEWNYQTENSIRINALDYGNYALQIRAKGSGGQWAINELNIPVIVQKPFYLKWSFGIGVLFALGMIIYCYFRYRILRLRRSREKLRAEVKVQTMELSKKNIELQASNQIKDKLFAIIAHDLRGPAFSLQDVGRKLNYLIESKQPQRLKEYGDTVDESVSRLTNLLDNLLNWANQSLKTTTLNPEKLNLQRLVHYSVNEIQEEANKKNIQLQLQVPAELETYSDKQAILTIVRNLLSNAIKFTHPGGSVDLEAVQKKNSIQLLIKDNGKGIEKERLAHIFDLQKNKSTRGTIGEKGTGLGLNVSKELAILNGGDIFVRSTPGVETIFTIEMPLFSFS